ncbi:O-antigen ligase family protein [Devosia ginsengisoli]|uniref:O-antigen ligase family protein n=1 Tax=Devosia ginsengisoli TaxID=400770 RepID=A0A5B8LRV0_9HYPH|nr:O-antigen ligase family protein [Devosia ginsengisoli]QDZ09990.1 O-antigen ligase family protein [Devosia ginsengisoli]
MSATGTLEGGHSGAGSNGLGLAVIRARAMRLLDVMVAVWIFTGGLVLFEPSPYELTFLVVLPLAFVAGLGLYRSTFGLLAILIGFTPFALIACFQVRFTDITDALIFSIVTIFLLLTTYFIANYVAEATERRMRLVMNAYTATAVISALVGTLAYLGIMPGADIFLRYGRAKAAFNDPNVFGPFLVLPAMYALQRVLLSSGRSAIIAALIYLVLFVGVFVSFSRAAWGHFALSSLIVLVLCFWLEAAARDKVRIMIMSLVGAAMLVVALAGLLSIPSVADLFETRAAGQNYDSGETGRFGRQGYAFELALDHPLGIGPSEFHNLRIIEEPHNVYVSVLHVYGWGGGAFYYLLVILTLWRGIAALTRPSPYRLMMIPLVATFTMLVGESAIIDSDHWRHYYLVAGLIWGIASAIGNDARASAPRERMLI